MGKLFALAWGEHQQTSLRIRGHSRAKFSTVFQITCSAVTSQLCTATHTRAEGSPWGCAPGKGARLLFISVFYRANMKWFLQETDTTLWIWKCNLALAGTNILNGTGKCQLAGTWSLWGKAEIIYKLSPCREGKSPALASSLQENLRFSQVIR